MRYLSICSGIEAASVAWHGLGWTPVAFSEIEPFPSAVLAHHYPHVPNLGDMTNFKEWNLGSVDLLVGGTPCQSFSVAGLRKGLHDPRGGLMLTFLEIAQRYRPRWVVWENVPGVLSSNGGRDFGAFLGALGELGYGWAYRVLDAQWFGVAQRRRRVFVVACLGDQASAAAVLFESESVQRNPPPSRETRQGVARGVGGGPADGSISGAVTRKWAKGSGGPAGDECYNMVAQPVANTLGNRGLRSHTELDGHGAYIPVAFHPTQDPISSEDGTTHAIGCGSKQGTATVAVAFKVRGGVEVDSAGKAAGKGYLGSEETAFTLAATQDQWIGQPVATFAKTHKPMSATDAEGWSPVDAAPTVTHWPRDRSDAGTDVAVVQPAFAWDEELNASVEVAGTLLRGGAGGRHDGVAYPVGTDCYNGAITGDVAETIGTPGSSVNASGPTVMQPVDVKQVQWASGGGQVENDTAQALRAGAEYNYQFARVAMQVRRLTPVECSRLQGFPDTYLELTYGTESEAHASQVLHELWKQTGAIAREGWRPGIVASLFTPEVLLAGVHGGWISWEMATCCAIAPRPLSSKVNYAERFVRRLQEAGQDGRSPYQRESFRQLSEELGCSLSQLPLEEAQARKVLLNSELWPQAQAQWPLRYALATEKQRSSGKLNADGPRYKALGNSMAVPCMRWIGERIQAATARQEVKP